MAGSDVQTMAEGFDGYARRQITAGFFRAMVGRVMFCPVCKRCLDYRDSVLSGSHVVCCACYDGIRARAVLKAGEEAIAAQERRQAESLDYIDGRQFDGGKYSRAKAARREK